MTNYKIVKDYTYSKLVNNDSKKNTLNEFLTFKESFSPILYDYLTDDFSIKNKKSIYEPFVGTGSIFLNKCIQSCFGEDVNPLSIKITSAKLNPIDLNETQNIIKSLDVNNIKIKSYDLPEWPSFNKYVPIDRYNMVKSFIDSFKDTSVYNYVNMVMICNLDKIFNYKHDGNGIKFRNSKIKNEDVLDYLCSMTKKALTNKVKYQIENISKDVSLFNSSSTKFNEKIKDVDLIITSPPYCNMFDYFEVYKIELWTSGIVKSNEDLRILKKSALRSNYNSAINNDEVVSNTLSECIENLKSVNCEDKKIRMIKNYFYDMDLVLQNSYKYLNNDSYMFIVVGNSFYSAKPVKTDLILAELAESHGFKVDKIIIARELSTSSQQMKLIADSDREYLRESIIVLRKV